MTPTDEITRTTKALHLAIVRGNRKAAHKSVDRLLAMNATRQRGIFKQVSLPRPLPERLEVV